MWRRYQIPLLLSLLLSLIVAVVLVQPGMPPEERVVAQSSASLSCEVFCSDTRLGVSVAELTFSGAASLGQLALEVTVYKNGFQIGRFARISPIRQGQRFEIIRPPGETGSAPGFDTLAVTAVRVQTGAGGLVTVRVEGLDAGLNYFWRVRPADGSGAGTEITVCQAVECPVDSEPPTEVPVIR